MAEITEEFDRSDVVGGGGNHATKILYKIEDRHRETTKLVLRQDVVITDTVHYNR